jgi:hypothetical protein
VLLPKLFSWQKKKGRKPVVVLKKFMAFVFLMMPATAFGADKNETVVLLHGIARTGKSMSVIEKSLRKEGYSTINLTYPFRELGLNDIAQNLHEKTLTQEFWDKTGKVHFVTHSMGGLAVRRYLEKYEVDIPKQKLGRVVMLGPPNSGSELADRLHKSSVYEWFYGPAGQELTTTAQAKCEKLYYDVGIIAGTKGWMYLAGLPGPHDGMVSVQRTKLDGMKGHITPDATHTFMMYRSDVHVQIIRFIKDGKFSHVQ